MNSFNLGRRAFWDNATCELKSPFKRFLWKLGFKFEEWLEEKTCP